MVNTVQGSAGKVVESRMLKHSSIGLVAVLCLALVSPHAATDSSTPTEPTPEVTLTGTWGGMFSGALVSGEGEMILAQDGTTVTGQWSAPMPTQFVALGAPADLDLAGPVTGTVSGTTATLALRLLEAFALFVGNAECGLDVNVTSFSQTSLEATYTTNSSCEAPVVDTGTLSFMRQ